MREDRGRSKDRPQPPYTTPYPTDYRDFRERDVRELQFIRRARDLGSSVEEIGHLLSLWRDRDRPSREVKAIAERHVADLDARIAEMQAMADALRTLAKCCIGDDRPDCPILVDLAEWESRPLRAGR